MTDFQKQLEQYMLVIDEKLQYYIDSIEEKSIVSEAMQYSLMNSGKRIRPVLALAFCDMLGGDIQKALPFACAVEMIHTYSLIHDDLPCMDDDDLRRGKPSCHKQFGEAYALLAGDSLLNLAFEIMFGRFEQIDAPLAMECGRILSSYAGIDGMIGGQTIDLESEEKQISLELLRKLQALKTGKLLTAPCKIGVLAAGGSKEDLTLAEQFGMDIGLQFQIVDDILDVTSTAEVLGKPIGSDAQNSKSTYVSLLGLEQSVQMAEQLKEKSLQQLAQYGDKAAFLKALVLELSRRKK